MLPLLLFAQFSLHTELMETRAHATIYGCNFADAHAAHIDCVLVEPRGPKAKSAAVIFQHGGGQTMMQYISEAAMLAESGIVSLIIDPPGRGRPNDMQKMNGAEIRDWMFEVAAAIISAHDRRPSVYVLTGGTDRISEHVRTNASEFWKTYRARRDLANDLKQIVAVDAANFLPNLKARAVLVQCAKFDMPDLMKSCPAVHDALQTKKQIEWYPIDHSFADTKAGLDRVDFLRRHLKR